MFNSGKNALLLFGCTICTIWGCERQMYLFEFLGNNEELRETFDILRFMLPH